LNKYINIEVTLQRQPLSLTKSVLSSESFFLWRPKIHWSCLLGRVLIAVMSYYGTVLIMKL